MFTAKKPIFWYGFRDRVLLLLRNCQTFIFKDKLIFRQLTQINAIISISFFFYSIQADENPDMCTITISVKLFSEIQLTSRSLIKVLEALFFSNMM